MNILFTAGGRRVELIEIFQQEFKDNQIFVADIINSAPALYLGEERFVIPKMSDSDALERILEICQDKNINAIIPLIDPELEFYAQNIDEFLKRNIRIVISESTTVMMTRNKWETYEFFRRNDIPTPTTYLNIEKVKDFPVISKPIKGSASRNVQIIYNP
ncbi:MAG: ATP-grasp domain-containing protein [Candidatus Omnitrophica bacterium]|nr:ATP-grasp domain-containing protein [Candidatus Omnitrophota bacterium]